LRLPEWSTLKYRQLALPEKIGVGKLVRCKHDDLFDNRFRRRDAVVPCQGTLIEGEGSVLLTSSLRKVVLLQEKIV